MTMAGWFHEVAEEEDGFLRLAAAIRVSARQSPHLAVAPVRPMLERAAASVDEAGKDLCRWGRDANAAAFLLVQQLPSPLRRLIWATVHRKRAGAVCVFELYERMLALRQDMRAPQHREFYLRLNETLCFMDTQEDLRACVRAHRFARQAQVLAHQSALSACGACGFALRATPPHIY